MNGFNLCKVGNGETQSLITRLFHIPFTIEHITKPVSVRVCAEWMCFAILESDVII